MSEYADLNISTGEPSTLKTYRKIALALSSGNEKSAAVKFFDGKIKSSPHGENERVLAAESRMMYLIISLTTGGSNDW
jgi:hypothetical protein